MVDLQLAQTSNSLFTIAFVAYVLATIAYFFRLAFTRVTVEGVEARSAAGERIGHAATALTVIGVAVHLGSVVTRGLAAGRPPWMNMYEFSSLFALLAVVVGVAVMARRAAFRNLMGFVLAAAVLMMTSALLLYADPAPVQPALESWYRLVHVTTIVFGSAVLMVGFAPAALYLVKDTAERRVATASGRGYAGSTVGAAEVDLGRAPEELAVEGRVLTEEEPQHELPSPIRQRQALSLRAFVVWPLALAGVSAGLLSGSLAQALAWGAVAAALGGATWLSVPYLPEAARLDTLAYRINAFGFPVFTFGVIMGAVWAEVTWGRYWGWDPKETASFVTWVAYAAYLHARSTAGWRGRRATWLNILAFAALLINYFVVNLVVSGLHSYGSAGLQ